MNWYRFGLRMARLRPVLAAGLVELLWHALSVGWALGLLILLYVISSLTLNTAQVQAQAAHQRIDDLVPHIGTIEDTANGAVQKAGDTMTGSLVVNGNHTIGGSLIGAGGTLTTISNLHVSGGGATVDDDLTVHGSHAVDGNISASGIHGSGTGQFDGGVNVNGSTAISSSRAFTGASIHVSAGVLADGTLAGSNFSGSYAGGQARPANTVGTFDAAHFTTACSTINTIMNELADAGLMT